MQLRTFSSTPTAELERLPVDLAKPAKKI